MTLLVAWNWSAVAQWNAQRLVVALVAGGGLGALAWVMLRMNRKVNSAARFAIALAALLATAVLPLVQAMIGGHLPAANSRVTIVLPMVWAQLLFGAWLVGAGIGLLRIVVGLIELHRFRRACSLIDVSNLPGGLQSLLAGDRVQLYCSERAIVPAALGFFKPAIIFPHWMLEQGSAAELELVLLHELAHLRRHDPWTNLAQKVARALLFFHPAAWWLERRISLEREMACDESVVRSTADALAYARVLTSLAEKSYLRRGMMLAQAAISRFCQTSLRVARLLEPQSTRRARLSGPGALAGTMVVLATVWALARLPQLVTFVPPGSPTVAATSPMEAAIDVRAAAAPNIQASPATLRYTAQPAVGGRAAIEAPPIRPREFSSAALTKSRLAIGGVRTAVMNMPTADHLVVQSAYYAASQRTADGETWRIELWSVRLVAVAEQRSAARSSNIKD